MASKNHWIQKSGVDRKGRKGLLHKNLGIKKGNKIPLSLLEKAAKRGGKIGERARFALNLRRIGAR